MLYTVNVASQVPNLSARVCAHDLQDCAKNQQAWSTFVSFATLVGQILRVSAPETVKRSLNLRGLAEMLKSLGIVALRPWNRE